jgi:hypothetical protein
MATEIDTIPAAAPGRRTLAWLAQRPQAWTIERAIALAGDMPAAAIVDAEETLRAAFRPVPRDGDERTSWELAMGERLKHFGSKIAPLMPDDAGNRWRKEVTRALSDLAPMISLTAAKRAQHRPMQFLNQVETAIREEAAIVLRMTRLALDRLVDLKRALRRAGQPALPPPPAAVMSQEEIDRLPVSLRRMGVAYGALTLEQAKLAADAPPPPPPRPPAGVGDHLEHGLPPPEAEGAAADHASNMTDDGTRSRARPIGSLLDGIGDAA